MSHTAAYPKILHVGDKQIAELFDDTVEITEKVDGSQFGFGLVNGELVCRSKGQEIDQDNPDKLFRDGIEYIRSIKDKLPDNVFFYAEYLQKPRHSTLAYDRIPTNHFALFGVLNMETRDMCDYDAIQAWSKQLDIDAIPLIYSGKSNPEEMLKLLDTKSFLGGQQIEGVVVKRYEPWLFLGTILLPVMAGKYVSERFKEVHQRDWTKLNTGKGQFEVLKSNYRSESRWNKAIQHLRDAGTFEGTVRDIGRLISEVQRDIVEEEKENIKDQLWKLYSADILRGSTAGFVDWYKIRIAKGEFNE